MSEQEFRFKRFSLYHGGSSFPIGTDAVILGAYAGKTMKARHILDIGTGCGIIALMLAQRFEHALVHAVEIDPASSDQARKNFSKSPYADRLTVFTEDISRFEPKVTYDLIVCNPPYFSKSLKPENETKSRSKHDEQGILNRIFSFTAANLNNQGLLQLVYPAESPEKVIALAKQNHLYHTGLLKIIPSPGKKPVRVILSFSPAASKLAGQNSTLTIENNRRHDYHKDYIELCKDFYRAFPD